MNQPASDLPKNTNNVASTAGGGSDDLLNLIRAVRLLWKHRKWIAAGTLVCTALGTVYALVATPVYTSYAIIAPKENDKNSSAAGMLAQMGDIGGLLASQIGGGGTSLERIAIIATSHDLAETVIARHNLLPLLFHKKYDFKNNCWKIKDPKKIPTIKKGAAVLKKNVLSVTTDTKKSILTLRVSIYDSVLAAKVANYYLDELDNKIRNDVISEAKDRRAYLDAQMKTTADPWVMQKLQALVGNEMEKSMMVAGASFQVLETPMVPLKKTKPDRRKMVMISFFLGLCLSGTGVLLWDYAKKTIARYSL